MTSGPRKVIIEQDARGVLYIHDAVLGKTLIRIQGLPPGMPDPKGLMADINVTDSRCNWVKEKK